MAITTMDGTLAGFQPPQFFNKVLSGTLVANRPFSTFFIGGIPGAATAPTPGVAGEALTTYPGQLPFSNPVSGNSYLARFAAGSSAQIGTFLLCDRLWHNSGINVNTATAQTINSVAWPARDTNGSTNGEGVHIGLEISTGTGVGAATPSISYTDQSGNSGASGSLIAAYGASSLAGAFYPFSLAAGDTGVRSIQSITLNNGMTSGTIHLVAYRILAVVGVSNTVAAGYIDPLTGGMPRLYDNTVPFVIFVPGGTTTTSLSGQMIVTQG